MIDVTRCNLLHVPHGFLGRAGGVSVGDVASLNVGLGAADDGLAVRENRRRAVEAATPGARLVTVYQVHSAEVAVVRSADFDTERLRADAMVTDRPGIALGILTADCAPVLLADKAAGVIGAAHAGWKGALAGVAEATVEALVGLGAQRDRIAAAVGPCIARASYEIDDDFSNRFTQVDPAYEMFFAQGVRSGHHQFDLEAFVTARLAASGVTLVALTGLDTYANAKRFFSYRRATHLGQPASGRQLSLIALG